MYKRGTDGFANSGLEPYGEYLSSELYNIITDGRSVQYDLVKLHSMLINLKGYEFKYDGCEKFPKERVKKLEWLVNRQIDRILK